MIELEETETPKIDVERERELDDLRILLSTEAGKRFFLRFFDWGKVLDVNMTGNSWSFFWEGHRNCAKKVWQDVVDADENMAAQLFIKLMKQSKGVKNG